MPRRRAGELLPIEVEILDTALAMRVDDATTFHGFGLARAMRRDDPRGLVGHGTLYKALGRLEEMGLLTSQWEPDPPTGRPRRRLYELSPAGVVRASLAIEADRAPDARLIPGTT